MKNLAIRLDRHTPTRYTRIVIRTGILTYIAFGLAVMFVPFVK